MIPIVPGEEDPRMLPDGSEDRNALPWFRFYTEFATDPAVQSLAFEDQRHFVVLLCLKGSGVLDKSYPTPERRELVLARALGLDRSSAGEALRRLVEAGLVDQDGTPSGWSRRQYVGDVSTERVRRFRERTKRGETVSETRPDTDSESETESKARPGDCGYVDNSRPTPAKPAASSQATNPRPPQKTSTKAPGPYQAAIERGLAGLPRMREDDLLRVVKAVRHAVRERPETPPEAVERAISQLAGSAGPGGVPGAAWWPYLVSTIPRKADALVEERLEREARERRELLARERRA